MNDDKIGPSMKILSTPSDYSALLLCTRRPTLSPLASLVGSFSTTPNNVHHFDATSPSSVCPAKRKNKETLKHQVLG